MLGKGKAHSHTPTADFVFKRFSAHLTQPVKWETMMLQVQAKAKVPQVSPVFLQVQMVFNSYRNEHGYILASLA